MRETEGSCSNIAKRLFARSAAVRAYLSRYTYLVVIFNSRLVALDEREVTFNPPLRANRQCRVQRQSFANTRSVGCRTSATQG